MIGDLKEWMRKIGSFVQLAIMFTPRIIAIEISKMANFVYFLLITAKNQSQFRKNM